MSITKEAPRIVIYGVGQYGQAVTRLAIEKGMKIVAAFNHAGAKVGQDLGQLAGLGYDLGVIVEDCDTADYSSLDADIGIVAATNFLEVNATAHKRLLGAGLNVLCHGAESYFPSACNPECAWELDKLAKQNNVTFTGGGIWDMSRIWTGIVLAGPCTEINSLFHSSITDVNEQIAVKEHLKLVSAGYTVEEFKELGLDKNPIAIMYRSIVEHVLVALGYTIKSTKEYAEPVTFTSDFRNDKLDIIIPAGDCVGTRLIGEIETHEGVTSRSEIELRFFEEGDVEHMYWEVDGKPRTRIRTERDDTAHATAACLFNRIPDVINARPGVVMVSELGPLKHTALKGA